MQYLNDEVIATFRQDMYNGTISKFVNTIAKVGVVHTLERSNNVKLYVDVTDNHSNIRFKEIEDGGTAVNAIVYVTDIRFDSSARAEWADLTVMDQARKIAQLRIFSPDSKIQDFKGRYVMCDIRKNRYGLSTDSVVTVDNAFPLVLRWKSVNASLWMHLPRTQTFSLCWLRRSLLTSPRRWWILSPATSWSASLLS